MAKMLQQDGASCLIGNHSFVQCGDEWVDVNVFKMPDAPLVRIRFDSLEYFELVARIPQALPWVLQSRNLQFLHGGTVYQVFE